MDNIVDEDTISAIVQEWTGIPVTRMVEDEKKENLLILKTKYTKGLLIKKKLLRLLHNT